MLAELRADAAVEEAVADDNGLDVNVHEFGLPSAQGGKLGFAEKIHAVLLLEGRDDDLELGVGQDAGEAGQGGEGGQVIGRIAHAGW